MNRACVFAHFDKDNIVDDYVYYYLKEILTVAKTVVFVTVSDINLEYVKQLEMLNVTVIKRDNIGYDFYSYKIGIESLDLSLYDELIVCNDSTFGPLISLCDLFTQMDDVNCDFWGITDSNINAYHIQSYFIVYRTKLVHSLIFQKSWNDIEILDNKYEIIEKYEIGLSQLYIKNAFSVAVYNKDNIGMRSLFAYMFKLVLKAPSRLIKFITNPIVTVNRIVKKQYNTSVGFWKDLLMNGDLPFLKKSLVSDNLNGKNNYREIEIIFNAQPKYSEYNLQLIENYMKRFQDIE